MTIILELTGKIKELSAITLPTIIKPQHVVLDNSSKVIGYTMQFVQNKVALCQLFPKPYKQRNNINTTALISISDQLRRGIQHCHEKNILLVDVNELNFIIDDQKYKLVYFIDVDSYQTPSFPATALMESVRDRHSSTFSKNTDWFAFGIVSFQMQIGIHPYKGKHFQFKTLDERMKANIPVFHKDVK